MAEFESDVFSMCPPPLLSLCGVCLCVCVYVLNVWFLAQVVFRSAALRKWLDVESSSRWLQNLNRLLGAGRTVEGVGLEEVGGCRNVFEGHCILTPFRVFSLFNDCHEAVFHHVLPP